MPETRLRNTSQIPVSYGGHSDLVSYYINSELLHQNKYIAQNYRPELRITHCFIARI